MKEKEPEYRDKSLERRLELGNMTPACGAGQDGGENPGEAIAGLLKVAMVVQLGVYSYEFASRGVSYLVNHFGR